jgi:hypothetical protein
MRVKTRAWAGTKLEARNEPSVYRVKAFVGRPRRAAKPAKVLTLMPSFDFLISKEYITWV